jgi:hypothetical protein
LRVERTGCAGDEAAIGGMISILDLLLDSYG